MGLLTAKPVIYAANMSEDDLMEGMLGNPHYQTVKKLDARASVLTSPYILGVVGLRIFIQMVPWRSLYV